MKKVARAVAISFFCCATTLDAADVRATRSGLRCADSLSYHHPLGADFFEGATRALLLASGAKPGFAEHVARDNPRLRITSTDVALPDNWKDGRINYVKMDNGRPFPFPDNSFDRVTMLSGTCAHGVGGASCGGIPFDYEGASLFFREVVRVLDKRQLGSLVSLDGKIPMGHPKQTAILVVWQAIWAKLEHEYPVQIRIRSNQAGDFLGVEIETIRRK